MFLSPLPFLLGWLAGLLSLGLLGGGFYILWAWYVGELIGAAWLLSSMGMLAWSLLGRFVVLAFYPRGTDEPHELRGGEQQTIRAPDGSSLHIEVAGPREAPTVVLTHGWGLDSTAWYYVRKNLDDHFRLILWDLPGLGRSSEPTDGRYSVERLAEDLKVVVGTAGGAPVTLVGHSIGGMMILTLARLHPEMLGREVSRIVLVNTTYTYPLNTIVAGRLLKALLPLIKALLYLTRWLWPLVWLMNGQSYLNGSSHIVNRVASFSRGVTRGQLDFGAWFTVKDKPSVVAKGLLAVLGWDEARTLGQISIPTWIITGDSDRITLPSAAEHMHREIPSSELVRITPAGHTGLIEEERQYSDAIVAGLRGTPGR